ncbi:MAG: DUF4214 domain-containing protein [Limnobacter sp.]|nr:DUF4214 domain-containing protein [Limnobacter sp.]
MAKADFFDAVQKIYIAYYGRPADPNGLDFWAGKIDAAGGRIEEVLTAFGSSAEAASLFGAGSTESRVNNIFQQVLGRQADPAGLNFYTQALNNGTLNGKPFTLVNVAQAILDGATGTDATTVANKLASAKLFTAAIDTTPEILAYSGNSAAATARGFLAGVTATAATPAQATASVASIVDAATTSTGQAISLTVGADNVIGGAGDDTITSRIVDNTNTFQSGDVVNGGAGNDRLNADVGNSQRFAITGETTGVETAAFRAQAIAVDTNNNNLSTNIVQIDAQRMSGVTQWESNNSRADLVIEDVRILPNQITRDITVAMVETDPGDVDFGLYFDQLSLRTVSNTSSTLRIQLMDTRSNAAGTGPLKDSPYNGFTFKLNGVIQTVTSPAIDAAQTYAELQTAIAAAVAANPALTGFTVALGGAFTVKDTLGADQTGTEIVLTSTNGGVISTDATTGFTAAGVVPSSSGLHTNAFVATTTSTDKVTAKVILDDVGRGSTGGDLVIGGLSVGDTSTSKGVERFEIEVRDNSKLQTINSTNNTLQEVTVRNGLTTSQSFAFGTTVKDQGNLSVLGNDAVAFGSPAIPGFRAVNDAKNNTLPGTTDQHNQFGFSDVRLIDATAMTGRFEFDAEVTAASIAKYLNNKDLAAPAADNVAFVYSGGSNNDSMTVVLDSGAASSRSNLNGGREDFNFTLNGNGGDDNISVSIVNGQQGSAANWYNNQKLNNNITINGGDGNDTIRTPGAGDANINLGTGNDTAYTDNTGTVDYVARSNNNTGGLGTPDTVENRVAVTKGVYVLNTADQRAVGIDAATTYVLAAAGNDVRNLADLRSDTTDSIRVKSLNINLSFKGIEKSVVVADTNFVTNDLQINQAIKNAINTDAVLSKLLVAEDGPTGTLIISSLIDGVRTLDELTIGATVPTVASGAFSTGDVTAYNAAFGTNLADVAALVAQLNANLAASDFAADYLDQFAETGANGNGGAGANAQIVGAVSTSTSDNVITVGSGNDVVVLGTTAGADATTTLDDSNERIVFSGSFDSDTIVNFAAGAVAGADVLDFRAYLTNTAGTPAASVATTYLNAAAGKAAIGVNTIAAINFADLGVAAGVTFASLNAASLTTALNTGANQANFGANANAAVEKVVFMVVSGANETKIFSADSVATSADFANVTLVGSIDFADTAVANLIQANFS